MSGSWRARLQWASHLQTDQLHNSVRGHFPHHCPELTNLHIVSKFSISGSSLSFFLAGQCRETPYFEIPSKDEVLTFIWKWKGPRMAKTIWKESAVRGHTPPDIKTYCKATVIRTVDVGLKIDQRSANLFRKGLDSKYFSLEAIYSLCYNYSTLLF